MGKGACITRMGAVRNYSTNTIMEKKQIVEGGVVWRSGVGGYGYGVFRCIEEIASGFSRC